VIHPRLSYKAWPAANSRADARTWFPNSGQRLSVSTSLT
jgi:hypothetical protein